MSAITKERIELFIKNPLENGLTRGEQMELARIALASLEAEPVAWAHRLINKRNGVVHPLVYGSAEACQSEGDIFNIEVMPLYTVPPAPVSVPDAMEMDDDFDSAFEHGKAVGWNAYRAAMLQSGNFRENKNSSTNNFREIAETSTNYPVIPSEVLSAIQKVAKIRADFDDFDGDRRGIGDCLDEAEQELIVTINKYASQLAAEPIAPNDVREQTAIPQVPVTPDGWISCSERMPIIGELNWRTSFPLL
ncbi:Eaa protein, partial [Salmonella enterica subsp. enterica]|nr:Eaa protein [Salmonella enterica subsp. enterica serovar Poona]